MPDDIDDIIQANLSNPIKRAQGDSGSMEHHSLSDQIEAARYLSNKAAVRRGFGIRFVKLIPTSNDDINRDSDRV